MTAHRLWTLPFVLLTLAHLLQGLGYASMILLPRYLDALGASRADVGAIMAAAAVGGLATRPLVGWALDQLGRKPTLIVGTLVLSTGMGLVAAIDAVGWVAYACRLVVGMGTGALFTGYFTMASDLVPEARRTEGLALFGVSGLIPLVVNPIATRAGVDPMSVRWFLPAMGGVIALSLLLLWALPESSARGSHVRPSPSEVLRALRHRSLWPVWVANIVFSALVALFMAFAIVVATDRGIDDAVDAWFAYAVGAVGVRLLGATAPERIGPSRLLAVALGAYVVGVAVLAGAGSWGALMGAGLLAGFGHGYSFPILASQTVSRSPVALRGTAMAAFTGIWDLTSLLAPPVLGLVADLAGDMTMLRLTAAVASAGLVLWAVLEVRGPGDPVRTAGATPGSP